MTEDSARATPPLAAVNEDLLVSCVSCGLCLPHCPTYRLTGLDSRSPRGRIAIITSVRQGDLELDAESVDALDSCVQCMGCLPACPSGVRYDEIIAPVMVELAHRRRAKSVAKRLFLFPLGRPRILRALTKIGAIGQRLHLVPARLSLPPLTFLRRPPFSTDVGERGNGEAEHVKIFVGCVMDAWFGPAHEATIRVLAALGYSVELTDPSMCCGALHRHAGIEDVAATFEGTCRREFDGDVVVFNSAGCGAQLSHFVDGAVDVMTLLARNIDRLRTLATPSDETIAIHDACHSRNLLRNHEDTHLVLGSLYRAVPLPDEGLCCGAGGAYSFDHPDLSLGILERKYAAISAVGPVSRLASGNPGCTAHIQAHVPSELARLRVVHPIELVAERLSTAGVK
jgi:glycolate oxidase iron-sulfur subunit